MKRIRINRYLASCGVCSRRQADRMVAERRIRLNGKIIEEPGTLVSPRLDRVLVDDRPVAGPEKAEYIILHKPRGTITTARDPEGRKTVLDLLPAGGARLFPVGRLDVDTDGLLLLTNDGRLAFRLTHPRYGVEKTYRARLDRPMEPKAIEHIEQGLRLEDGLTAPARVRVSSDAGHVIEITIHEGRKRQVRRVFESLGYRVEALRRIRFGSIRLGALKPGEWRPLTHEEVRSLRSGVGLLHG